MSNMRRQRHVLSVGLLLTACVLGGSEAFVVPASRIRPLPSLPSSASFAITTTASSSLSISSSSRRGFYLLSSTSTQQQRLAGRTLSMLKEPKGSDAFARLLEKEASLSPLAKLQSGPAKVLKFTSVPLAAVGGFLATPKAAGGMFRVFGGVVGGFALKQLNQKLRSIRHSGAEVAVAHLLLDYESDISSLTPSAIKAVTAKYDVNYAEHLEIMRSLYTSFLLATLQWPEVRMNEPASLVDLSTALGLDSSTIGDAHCAAAEEIARMLAEVPFEEREEAWEQGMVGKLLFLSDRLYTQLEEEETREYELGRVTEILGLTPKEGVDKVQALVLPYYTSIVKDGMRQIRGGGGGEGEAMDGPKLVKWRQSLGVSEAQANRLHSEEFAKEVTRCVEAGQGRVRDGDADVLLKVRQLLGISSFESERALESVTAPLLRQSIVEMLTALTATPADTWPDALLKVRQRQKELKMVDSALVFHIKDVYRERLKGLIRQANEAAAPLEAAAAAAALEGKERGMEAGEGAKLRKTVGAAMLLMRLMRQFLEVNNLDEVMDEDLFNLKFLNLLPGELNKREREVTFRQYVSAVVSAKLVMEEGGAINELGMFLEMDPAYVKYTLKAMVGPIYEQKVREFVVEKKEMTDENQQVLLDIMRDFRVDDADVRRIGLAVYEAKVHEFFDGKKEFTEAELSELERVKGFLLLSDADVDRIHEPLARDEFLKVVKAEFVKQKTATATAAVPSTTGRAGGTSASLVALSRRLGLSEDARDELLGEALTTHVSPMLSNLKTTFRTLTTPAAELAEERGVDEGEDPFIKGRGKEGLMIKTDNTRNGNLLVEAVELVSFLEANEGYRATPMNLDDEGHMAKRSTDSAKGKRTVTSYVCKAAMGGGRAGEKGNKEKEEEAEESQLAEEMYKAFVQTVAGAAEGEKKERYRVVQDKFGAALGIHPPRMEALKFDLYASKMRKLVRSCLEVKGMMGADDNAELSLLNTQYAIGEERAGRLVLREKKKWLAGTLVSLIQAPPNVLGPTINKLRMTAANMGIDLSEDVPELTPGNKEFLFMKELAWLLEEGPEDADAETITDAVEQFGVEESSANRIILQEFNAASRQACVDLMGNMERSDYLGAFRDLGRLVRIGRCVPLPLAFNQEALLGMAVCGEVRRLWSSYAAVLGTTSAAVGGGSKGGIDLSAVIQGVNAEELAAFKAGFDEEDEIVGKLIGGLEALPETAGDIDLTIDYRGRKVTRKRPGGEDMMDNKEEWADGELEMMEKGGRKIVLGEDGKEMTILDIIRKAIDTRHTFMGQKKRRTGPKKKGEKPVNAQGRRAALFLQTSSSSMKGFLARSGSGSNGKYASTSRDSSSDSSKGNGNDGKKSTVSSLFNRASVSVRSSMITPGGNGSSSTTHKTMVSPESSVSEDGVGSEGAAKGGTTLESDSLEEGRGRGRRRGGMGPGGRVADSVAAPGAAGVGSAEVQGGASAEVTKERHEQPGKLLIQIPPVAPPPSPQRSSSSSLQYEVRSQPNDGPKEAEDEEVDEDEDEEDEYDRQWREDDAALRSLLDDIKRGRVIIDSPLLDRLLLLGREVFDPPCRPDPSLSATLPPSLPRPRPLRPPCPASVTATAARRRPRSGSSSSNSSTTSTTSTSTRSSSSSRGRGRREGGSEGLAWYAHLFEAIAISELDSPPCLLHRARLLSIFQCAAFFCRIKGGAKVTGFTKSDIPRRLPLPPVCQAELKRRLATWLATFHCPKYLTRDEVDALRRDNVLLALRWLESPLAPLEITVRSVLMPLLEGLCCDVLMTKVLGEEVTTRLELEVGRLEQQQQQMATPALWRAAGAIWDEMMRNKKEREGETKGSETDATFTRTTTRTTTSTATTAVVPDGCPGSPALPPSLPPPPYSRLAEAATPHIEDLLQWLRTDKAVLTCRHGSSLNELLLALPPSLRLHLHHQEYESPADFMRVFNVHALPLSRLSLPPTPVGCLPMPPCSPPRRLPRIPPSLPPSSSSFFYSFRECHRLAPSLAQVLKDLEREEGVGMEGGKDVLKGVDVKERLSEIVRTRTGDMVRGVEGTVQRALFSASRTVFGGDVFFIVRDLFGGDGVVVAPMGAKGGGGGGGRGGPAIVIDVVGGIGGKGEKDSCNLEHQQRQPHRPTPSTSSSCSSSFVSSFSSSSSSPFPSSSLPILKIIVTSHTSYGLYSDEEVTFSAPSEGCGHHHHQQHQQQQQQHQQRQQQPPPLSQSTNSSSSTPPPLPPPSPPPPPSSSSVVSGPGPHPMIILHATLVETLAVVLVPVEKRGGGGGGGRAARVEGEGRKEEEGKEEEDDEKDEEEEKELRVLTRGFGAGRVLCLKAERPVVTPCPSPTPSPRPAAGADAAPEGESGGNDAGPGVRPKWESDEISV